MSDLYPTKTRLDLLRAVAYGRVTVSPGSQIIHRTESSFSRRCDSAIREQEAVGWVRLGADGGTYEPTEAGRAVLDGAR
jgi:hypothetical protein